MRVALLIALCLLSSTAARADWSADEFLARYGAAKSDLEKSIWQRHIEDMSTGFEYANVALIYRGDTPLYCQPKKIALTAEQLADIMKRFLEDNKNAKGLGSGPIGAILLLALQDAFPCDAKQK